MWRRGRIAADGGRLRLGARAHCQGKAADAERPSTAAPPHRPPRRRDRCRAVATRSDCPGVRFVSVELLFLCGDEVYPSRTRDLRPLSLAWEGMCLVNMCFRTLLEFVIDGTFAGAFCFF